MERLSVERLAEILSRPTKSNKDQVIIVSGDEGDGKSSFSLNLARTMYKNFNIWKHIVYTESIQEYRDKYKYMDTNGVLSIDEAIKLMYKMDFMKTDQKDLHKAFAADQRKEKHGIYFLNIPHLTDLQTYYRERRAKVWIEILPREYFEEGKVGAVVFRKPRIPFLPSGTDPWLFNDNYKRFMTMLNRRGYDLNEVLKIMRNHPFYMGEVLMDKLPDNVYQYYLECRERAKQEYQQASETEEGKLEQKYRKALVNIIKYLHNSKEYSYNYKQIADILGVSQDMAWRFGEKY